MNIYPIPDSLSENYKGCGIALAATQDEKITALLYIRDLDPDFPDTVEAVPALIENAKVAAAARGLEAAFGFVRVGMVSCWEFCEL